MVYGDPGFHLAPTAAWRLARSSMANCLLVLEAYCFFRNGRTAALSAAESVETVTKSKLRRRYMRNVVCRSRNWPRQVLHLVDQKLTRRTFPVPFARSFLRSSASTGSTVTGSAWIFVHSSSTPVAFDIHFVVQPKALVVVTGTGCPASIASIALRASCDLTSSSRWLSSIRP